MGARRDAMPEHKKRKQSRPNEGCEMSGGESPKSRKAPRLQHGDAARHRSSEPSNGPSEPQKDWRQVICSALQVSSSIGDDDLKLKLGTTLQQTTFGNGSGEGSSSPTDSHVSDDDRFYQILHRVKCYHSSPYLVLNPDLAPELLVYSDELYLQTNDDESIGSHLAGKNRVSDIQRFIERNTDMSFVVIRDYQCCDKQRIANPENRLRPTNESIIFTSADVCHILNMFHDTITSEHKIFDTLKPNTEYVGLFFMLHRHIATLKNYIVSNCDQEEWKHHWRFLEYIRQHKTAEYKGVSDSFSRREVGWQHLSYLLVPGDILVLNSTLGVDHSRGAQLTSQPKFEISWMNDPSANGLKKMIINTELELRGWDFDGNFQQTDIKQRFHLEWDLEALKPMSALPFIPFSHAEEEMRNVLIQRGNMFWKCRFQKYVSYDGWGHMNQDHYNGSRFMIDYGTSQKMSEDWQRSMQGSSAPSAQQRLRDDLGQEAMQHEEPPGEAFLLTLPVVLPAFKIDDKTWRSLLVSRMKEVVWDEKAFHSLVVPDDTKDVIRALVTHRVTSPLSPDIIRGKGTGLLILLHGPPGTGKTLTAESVAEHSRKPLYRVTCGDIGTKPSAVEQYLGGVLRQAKHWDCVVLLDEAEVFLQERSLTDLERNALVSVFLRVLEYHDGILILTSNRVGTLDEGFRSRIQLALEYPKLNTDSRRRVWGNFIERLENSPLESADVDLRDLRQNLSNLSKYELNGREIRNAISVARPLALSTGTQVDFKCLQKVIGVQRRFMRYIEDVNEGLDDEKVAREEGKR